MKWYLAAALIAASVNAPAAEWTRVQSQNIDLYTSAGEGVGRDFGIHFEEIRSFFAQASPVKPPGDFPLRIIVFSNAEEFRPYSPNATAAALFQRGPDRDYILIRDASPQSKAIAIHEYMHFVIRHSGLRLPLWLSEGWADVYSSMRRVKDGTAVGDLIPGRMRALESSRGSWFDFETLTGVTDRSPVYNEGDRTGLFYAESWALTHMLFLSPEYRPNFSKFLQALHGGASAGDAARTAYGKIPAQVFADLTSYFDRKKLLGTVFQTELTRPESDPLVSPLSEFDAKLALADVQLAMGRIDLARIEYERLEASKPDHARLQKSLGYLFLSLRDGARAKLHMAKAFAAGETDPKMCYTLSGLQLSTGEPVGTAIASLERAIATSPAYTDALLQMGLLVSLTRQFQKAVDTLMAVPAVTPDKAFPLFNALAYAYLQTGNVSEARIHLETAGKYAKSEAEKKTHAELSRLLEGRANSPYPPRPGEELVRAEGTVTGVECSPQGQKLQITIPSGGALLVDLPAPAAIEFIHKGEGNLRLTCGRVTQPFKVAIEYARASAMRQASAGVVRTFQF